ncbi:MAG: FAD-dependent oxidoreductase [Dehalococcoidia bacterium]|jgi:2-enoate reductase
MLKKYQGIVGELIDGYGDWFNDEKRLDEGRMTDKLYPYDKLFSPIDINGIKVKNRIVMGPMGNVCMCDETGRPNNKMIRYFIERARGGTGLITSGVVPVSFNVDPSLTEPGDLTILPRIDRSRTVFPGWRILAEGVHSYGARFFIQLSPGLGRVGSPECLVTKFKLPVSASWNPNFYTPAIPCRPLTDGECHKIIKNAGQAAADAQALLIDGVYLHGHEGYLLEQMANTAFNRRKLGRFSDWQAFGIDLVRQIRQRCGDRYPIMYRIDLSLALNETYGKRMAEIGSLKKFRRERTVEMTLDYMSNLVKAGVDIFDVDLGCHDNWWLPHPPGPMPPGLFLPVAKLVKDYFVARDIKSNAGKQVPVVGVGKLGYPDLAEHALRSGMCDMVMLARPLLADPEWPNKAYAGRVNDIRPCIGDQEACLNEFIRGGHTQCAVNPQCGFEDVLSLRPAPVARPRRIEVVGAGPAGIICACTAAERGHNVSLYEKLDKIGGELVPGSVPKIKYDVANYLQYLENLVQHVHNTYQLKLYLNIAVTPESLKEHDFDVIVTCTGARPVRPAIEGIGQPFVVQAVDFLRDPALAGEAQRPVVIGGGSLGCEVAYMLAYEMEKKATIVEMLPYFMKDACTANRGQLIHYLETAGVKLMNCTSLVRVGQGSVTVARNVSRSVPDPYNTWSPVLQENIPNPLAGKIAVDNKEVEVETDLVILAIGLKQDDSLYEACLREHIAPEIHNIGDSFSIGGVFEATKAGYAVGSTI